MLGACIDLELLQLLTAEGGLGQHAANSALDDLLRGLLHSLAEALSLKAAVVAAVAIIGLRVGLVTGKLDLIGVDDDNEVAAVAVGRELRLVLTAQDRREPSCAGPRPAWRSESISKSLRLLHVQYVLLQRFTGLCK